MRADMDRLPHEVCRSMALDFQTFATEVKPGLSAIPEPNHLRVVDRDGTTVARVPRYRLASVEIAYLAASLETAYDDEDADSAALDQAVAAVREGRAFDRPDRDYIIVPVGEGEEGLAAALILPRGAGVPSWPVTDQCDMETARLEVDGQTSSYPWGYDGA